jgi:hypothetical protein
MMTIMRIMGIPPPAPVVAAASRNKDIKSVPPFQTVAYYTYIIV